MPHPTAPFPLLLTCSLLSTLTAIAFLLIGAVAPGASTSPEDPTPPPEVPREFRGAWIATVANIDWPSEPGLPVEEQQAELRAMLDRAVSLNLNAVIFQVRPAADAFYDSPYEPWSEYLTGEMGRAPEPFYDPLAFAIEEAHARGLELHAWFNPFRARHSTGRSPASDDHITRTDPRLVRSYGSEKWLDPGESVVQNHARRVILDVVRRYDIDGVHFDDYFYPYPARNDRGRAIPFPDETSWSRAVEAGTSLSRSDWRRENINRFVRDLYQAVKQEKPHVKFGISPFGIWRPGHPEQIRGLDAYGTLYADARKWLREGWVDYLSPQLYWTINRPDQSYPVLLQWWHEQNTQERHLWPGNYTSRVGDESQGMPSTEILEQIRLTRTQEGASGNVHFSFRALMQNPDRLNDRLAAEVYDGPALVPPSPWLDDTPPAVPEIGLREVAGELRLTIASRADTPAGRWVIRARYGRDWDVDILPASRATHTFRRDGRPAEPDEVHVTAVSRTGIEGPAATLRPSDTASRRTGF